MPAATDIEGLAFDFFREFARCEYCLKAVGLRERGRNAKADWDAFAGEIREVLDAPKSPETIKAVEYYLTKPPNKQIVENGES